jgi:predicted transcriptional regulator
MPISTPLSIDDEGVLDLMRNYDALRTWELIRVSRAPITVPELASATHMDARVLHRQIDLLMRYGLVQRVRARKPRRTSGYRVTCDRIVLAFDDARPQSVARATQSDD